VLSGPAADRSRPARVRERIAGAAATSADANANGVPDECEANGGTPFCFGDDNPSCPCANDSAPGAGQGCRNSTGAGGKLVGTGSIHTSTDTLTLHATNLVSGVCIFLQGKAVNLATFGDGLVCAGSELKRLASKTVVAGAATYPQVGDLAISVKGAVPPNGGPRNYQVYYRDPIASPCGTLYNITSGVRVYWQP
jgi:hypothetical protein